MKKTKVKVIALFGALLLSVLFFMPWQRTSASAAEYKEVDTATVYEDALPTFYDEVSSFTEDVQMLESDCNGVVYSTENVESDVIGTDSITLVAEDEADDTFYTDSQNINNRISSVAASSTQATIYGTYTWQDMNGIHHPLRWMLIELYVGGSKKQSQYTSATGSYSFTFTVSGTASVYLCARSEGEDVLVRKNLLYQSYACQSSTISVSAGESRSFNRTIPHNEDGQTALIVAQALVYGRKYIQDMGETAPNAICHYPHSANEYDGFMNFLHIKDYSCDYWDIILHEYGHRVQDTFNIEDNPGLEHGFGEDLINRYGKDKGIRTAWGEGWPTFFGILVTRHFGSRLSNVPNVNDDIYHSYSTTSGAWQSSIENYYSGDGEGDERAIAAVLYDMYDAYNSSETFDTLSISEATLFKAVTASKAKNFSAFINYFYNNYYSPNDGKIGSILSNYGFAARNLRSTNSSITYSTPPTFTWNAGGPTSSTFNGFELAFYDEYDRSLFVTGNQSSTTYTLTSDQWLQILNRAGSSFSVAVVCYQTTKPSTGAYYSAKLSITTPTIENPTVSASFYASTRYFERQISLSAGQYYDYNISFSTAGTKIIQTFGAKDTKLELYSASGTLLASNDDGGYKLNALIKYYTSSNTTYRVRVKFYSSSVFGTIKLAITSSYGSYSNGTGISVYEDIYSVTDNTSFTFNTYAQKDYSRMITFTPPSSANYTFSIESDFDTYIYVIDPRTSELIVSGQDYDDDSGEGLNPKLTKKLEAGIPYLVIYSAYNPNSLTEIKDLVLKIKK